MYSVLLCIPLPRFLVKIVFAQRHLLLACVLFLTASGCESEDRGTRTVSPETSASLTPNDEELAIIAAARGYLDEVSDVDSTNLSIVAVQGDYVRLLATPPPDVADPATVFLKKTDRGWEGVALGTMFTPDDFDALDIPNALREIEE